MHKATSYQVRNKNITHQMESSGLQATSKKKNSIRTLDSSAVWDGFSYPSPQVSPPSLFVGSVAEYVL